MLKKLLLFVKSEEGKKNNSIFCFALLLLQLNVLHYKKLSVLCMHYTHITQQHLHKQIAIKFAADSNVR